MDIVVELGGSDSQRLFAFNMRRTRSAGKVMVTDARGRLLYINNEMREMLGYTVSVGWLFLPLIHFVKAQA